MGKNAHPPRNHGKKVQDQDDLGSNVVFTNDLSDKKKKPPAEKKPTEAGSSEAVQRPDTRKLIGGSSWTGKLPVTLLNEHCQKLKWEKPEYNTHKTSEGFLTDVVLKSKNVKTQEVTTLSPIRTPPSLRQAAAQPTALESRHFAATHALFRISSMKNIHMMLPPTYKDLWRTSFQDLKKADVQDGKAWMYEADPFLAEREHEAAKAQVALKKEANKKAAESSDTAVAVGANGHGAAKGWKTAAKVEMGAKLRRSVETAIRGSTVWNPMHSVMPQPIQVGLLEELTKSGFRPSHVQEAIDICRDKEEVLEWLLVHVPEDDLPSWALPEKYSAGVTFASNNLERESSIGRLSMGGYSREMCAEVLDSFAGNESKAAQALQNSLLGDISLDDLHLAESNTWAEEQVVLASIYGDRFQAIHGNVCRIEVTPNGCAPFKASFRKSDHYPASAPIFSVDAKLPAYIRLSIIRRALDHAMKEFSGSQMLFNIIDWLEQHTASIVDDPGRLVDVAAGANMLAYSEPQSNVTLRTATARRVLTRPLIRVSDNSRILEHWTARQATAGQQRMLKGRQLLPAWSMQEAVVSAINAYQVTIISGETGSGKSTQSVQFILDDAIQANRGATTNIICTQPRRISALSLAERVAEERCSTVGDEVGYAIRGESKQKRGSTRITFVTTGVLLRRLQVAGHATADLIASLADVSHIVLDEVHERNVDTDFLLALLKNMLKERKDLKLILMSATLDASNFETYFGGPRQVARVQIHGRTFPVEDHYIDEVASLTGMVNFDDETTSLGKAMRSLGFGTNYDLIVNLVEKIDKQLGDEAGGILIFLSGTVEIKRASDALQKVPRLHVLPLHASLLPSEQKRVFPPAPPGKRKVIVSTNVAETSITIPDIVVVIDSGRVKETRYDVQTKMVKLEEVWASKAACKQRRGRAGRVTAGLCYKLYTRNAEAKMAERPEPEICRIPLEQLCLSVRAMGVDDVQSFLKSTVTPPEDLAIESALALLQVIGALDGNTLTALGRHMALIPADLRCAKLLVHGSLFGLLEPCLTIAAILSVKSPFVSPQDKRNEAKTARLAFGGQEGDVITDLKAFNEWSEMRAVTPYGRLKSWCEQNFLSMSTLHDIATTRGQYLSTLKEIGLVQVSYKESHRQAPSFALLTALVMSALYPQTIRISFPSQKYMSTVSGALAVDPESREIKYFDANNSRVFLHPSSTLFSAQSFGNAGFLSYFSKVETSKVFIRELSPCRIYGMLFFGGKIELDTLGRGLTVDGWIKLRGWARIGVLVSRLRGVLDNILDRWIEEPGSGTTPAETEILSLTQKLIELDGMDR